MVDVRTADGVSDDEALRLAAAVERDAEHPVARAIVKTRRGARDNSPDVTGFESIAGTRRAQATVEGRQIAVGGPNLLTAARSHA